MERKFIVESPPDLAGVESEPIEQGYLAVGSDGEVRLRRKGDDHLLTVKRGAGLSRAEEEIELDRAQFEALWPLTEGRRLRKRRHVIPHGDLRIELDVYEDELEGLRVAEVEFPDERAAGAFEPPPWLGADVTGEDAYLNESLAVDGIPR